MSNQTERINRNLDGVYFRIKRGDKFESVCFSDMTEDEMDRVLECRNEIWFKSMCKILGQTIRQIGDQLDLRCE